MTIGFQTILKASDMVTRQLRDYVDVMDKAYTRAEGPLDVGLKINFAPGPGSSIKIKTSINFVTDRVKDHMEATVDEKQLQLFSDQIQEETDILPARSRS